MFGHKNKPGCVLLKSMAVTLTMPIRPYCMFNTSDYNILPALYGWLTLHYVLVLAVFFPFFRFVFSTVLSGLVNPAGLSKYIHECRNCLFYFHNAVHLSESEASLRVKNNTFLPLRLIASTNMSKVHVITISYSGI